MTERALAVVREFLNRVRPRSMGVITHVNPDPDAVASAVFARLLLEKMSGTRAAIIFPEGPSRISKKLLSSLSLDVSFALEPPSTMDAAIVIDTPSSTQLSSLAGLIASLGHRVLVIDHHASGGDLLSKARYRVWRPEVACTVILVELLTQAKVEIDAPLATLGIAGIIYDTARFQRATPQSLRAVARLMEMGGAYDAALSSLQEPASVSERIARLKAASRVSIVQVGNVVVAGTYVASHEAAAARALLGLGADVAVVVGGKRGELRVSMRASRDFVALTGLSLGRDIVPLLTDILGGEGGGHDTSAGFNAKGNPQRALSSILRVIYSEVSSRVFGASKGKDGHGLR